MAEIIIAILLMTCASTMLLELRADHVNSVEQQTPGAKQPEERRGVPPTASTQWQESPVVVPGKLIEETDVETSSEFEESLRRLHENLHFKHGMHSPSRHDKKAGFRVKPRPWSNTKTSSKQHRRAHTKTGVEIHGTLQEGKDGVNVTHAKKMPSSRKRAKANVEKEKSKAKERIANEKGSGEKESAIFGSARMAKDWHSNKTNIVRESNIKQKPVRHLKGALRNRINDTVVQTESESSGSSLSVDTFSPDIREDVTYGEEQSTESGTLREELQDVDLIYMNELGNTGRR